jgi:vacuolar protein sorting-associated protein 13A/C
LYCYFDILLLTDLNSDFVSEPVKGFKKSVKELDPSYVMDGVAKGTGSLARHTVGGIVDSASLLTETFSKNMAVLTLDRKYAQRRDRFKTVPGSSVNFVEGVESGITKLVRGVAEGVIGVVRAPMRGAEKRGMEGFAKGVGKGLLGLIVKPVIGLSDAATDVMIGVKGSIEVVSSGSLRTISVVQVRPRRAVYGEDRRIRPYAFVDAISSAILMKTSLAGEEYMTHIDLGGRVVIISIRRFLLLGDDGEAQLIIKLKSIKSVEVRQSSNNTECGVVIMLKSSRRNVGNDTEVIYTDNVDVARELCAKIRQSLPVDFR